MKISELMKDRTPKADYKGFVTNDDTVLAINIAPNANTKTDENDYRVLQIGVEGLDPQMNPETQDKQYIRAGKSTTKTGTQRSFKVTGDKYIGDDALDYCLSHQVKYGTGNEVVTDYIFFNLLTGEGEKGQCSIIVNSDGGGNSGENAAIDIELKKIGSAPVEWKYGTGEVEEE